MYALIFNKQNSVDYRQVIEPEIRYPDEVLLRIIATGICGTDIHILSGAYPARDGIILGHESTGIVEAIGPGVQHLRVGDSVVLDPTYHCGTCSYCQTGRPNYCIEKSRTETGVSHHGTFAELHVAKASFVHRLPEGVSFTTGTLTEPLACVLNALRQSRIRLDSRVLVVGAGPLGLLFAITTQRMGCDVTVGELDGYRVERARALVARTQDYRRTPIAEMNAGRRYDVVVDTSGKVFAELLPIVDRGGDILVTGLDYGMKATIQPSYLTDNGIRLIGSIDSNRTMIPALSLLSRHEEYARIVTHEYPMSSFEVAFSTLGLDLATRRRGPIFGNKVVLHPGE